MADQKSQQSQKTNDVKMVMAAASRIQSLEARNNAGRVEKGSFAARAQQVAAKYEKNYRAMADQESPQSQKTLMTTEDAARIQSSEARNNDGGVEKESFAARAQRAAAKNEKADS